MEKAALLQMIRPAGLHEKQDRLSMRTYGRTGALQKGNAGRRKEYPEERNRRKVQARHLPPAVMVYFMSDHFLYSVIFMTVLSYMSGLFM